MKECEKALRHRKMIYGKLMASKTGIGENYAQKWIEGWVKGVRKKAYQLAGWDWKITLRKGAEVFIYGGIGALIAWLTEFPQTETVVATIAVLKMLQNYIKHRNA